MTLQSDEERKKRARKAYRIRKKIESGNGKGASKDEKQWLASYEMNHKPNTKGSRQKKNGKSNNKSASAELAAIRRAHGKLTRARERLGAIRKEWNGKVAEDFVAVGGSIEAPPDTYVSTDNQLKHIQQNWQSYQENIAGKKSHEHEALDEKRKTTTAFQRLMDNPNQTEMNV